MSDPKSWTRRATLAGGAGVLAAGAAVGLRATSGGPAPRVTPPEPGVAAPQVPTRRLGKTNKQVPIINVGTGMGVDARFDPRLAEAVLFGVNYFDTADCYDEGRCESGVGSYLSKAKNRDKIWLTSKSDRHDPKGFEESLNQSLAKLGTDYIDLFFLHALKDGGALTPELKATVDRLKAEGKIRHFGFSCHSGTVVQLLNKAAATDWVEAVMFRYNFRKYGDKELNAAMDKCKAADVGMIAMKTQGSEAGFADAWQKFQQAGPWNKYQAVLHAVWADERIASICSAMETLDQQRENIAAALNPGSLGQLEWDALDGYADATRHMACDGCDHLCNAAVDAPVEIGNTLRYLMYHQAYGQTAEARRLYAQLPAEARRMGDIDFQPANRACPHGVDVSTLMHQASKVLG